MLKSYMVYSEKKLKIMKYLLIELIRAVSAKTYLSFSSSIYLSPFTGICDVFLNMDLPSLKTTIPLFIGKLC